MSRSILAIEALMKPSASSKSCGQRFICVAFLVEGGGAQFAQARDQRSSRSASNSLVKPMMLTSGARRSWLTI